MSHPAGLPDLFIDRSLGRILVPHILRAAGLRLTTLAERYGVPADETVSDVTWLSEAGQRGEAVFMKDARVRYNPAEKQAVHESRVKACGSNRVLAGQRARGRATPDEMGSNRCEQGCPERGDAPRAYVVVCGAKTSTVARRPGAPPILRSQVTSGTSSTSASAT